MLKVNLTIPPNTPESAPVRKEVKVPVQQLFGIRIVFPGNAAFLTHIQIEHRGQIIAPITGSTEKWIEGDGWHGPVVIDYPVPVPIQSPGEVIVHGWSEDDTYTRTHSIHLVTGN